MNDQQSFETLLDALAPWQHKLVYIGGWAHRLHRLAPGALVPAYTPLLTRDSDVAFAERERLEGNIKDRLEAAGFREQLTGSHQPPVSSFTLGEDQPDGFYAEFLTPLTGSGQSRNGKPQLTVMNAGVTAQRLRYLELLLHAPLTVTLPRTGGDSTEVRIPNPVSFIVQKLLIHQKRPADKQAQDLLYIHDTLELFADNLDRLREMWAGENGLRSTMDVKTLRKLESARETVFGNVTDTTRDAAAIRRDRALDPARMRDMCAALVAEILD